MIFQTPPQFANNNGLGRAGSSSGVCSTGSNAPNHAHGGMLRGSFNNISEDTHDLSNVADTVISGSGCNSNSIIRSFSTGSASPRDCRSGASRRNLDREFDFHFGRPLESRTTHLSPSQTKASTETTRMMSLLRLNEENCFDDTRSVAFTGEQAKFGGQDSFLGLYDANRNQDEMDIYAVRNGQFRSSPVWDNSMDGFFGAHRDDTNLTGSSKQNIKKEFSRELFLSPPRENLYGESCASPEE